MAFHAFLLRVYQHPITHQLLRLFRIHTAVKDCYWMFRWVAHGTSARTISDTTIRFETYAIPTNMEQPVITDLLEHLRPDDVFYDIGADRGWYTCFVGSNITRGHAVAFEPHPSRRRVLRRNLNHNELADSTTIQPQALGNRPERVEFSYAVEKSGGVGELTVKMEKGDRVIEEGDLPRATVLKIDVEGLEQSVLEGMENTISDSRLRLIYLEMHADIGDFNGSWDEVRSLLEGKGFEIQEVHQRRKQSFWRAERER